MERFKDIHTGKRIWVCGSGPSLLDVDVKRLPKDDIIIACNSATYHFKKMNYAVFTDESVNHFDYYTKLNRKKCTVIALNPCLKKVKKDMVYLTKKQDWKFKKDDTEVIFGYDVIHCAVHLAWYMGARQIVLAGVDLKHKSVTEKYAYPNNYNDDIPAGLKPIVDESMRANDTLFDGHLGLSHGGWELIKVHNNVPVVTIALNGNLNLYPKISFDDIIRQE